MDPGRIAALEALLGHRFRDHALLERALTHRSYAGEHPGSADHEALALLGDAALALVVTEHLLGADPEAPVGVLTPRRAELVSDANLARWAIELQLGPLLRLGRGEDQTGGRGRESVLATSLEAVLGVVYLEEGLAGVRSAVVALALW